MADGCRITLVALLIAGLASCSARLGRPGDDGGDGDLGENVADGHVPDGAGTPDAAPAPDVARLPDAAPDADAAGNPDAGSPDATSGAVEVYPPLPGDAYRSAHYDVAVGQAGSSHGSYVYQSDNDHAADPPGWDVSFEMLYMSQANHWTSFSFSGAVTVAITLRPGAPAATATSATVRPLSRGVTAKASGATVTLTLHTPGIYYVEIPGMQKHPLFLFANPVEASVPSPGDPDVIFFGPGVHHAGVITPQAGQTVYLAGGAYVRGRVFSSADQVTVRGRGVLSGIGWSTNSPWDHHLVYLDSASATDLTVEGLVLTDSPKYCVYTYGRITVDNVKCLAWHVETDGFTASGAGSRLTHSFFKINDDVIKLIGSDLTASGNVIWWQLGGSAFQLSWNAIDDVSNVVATETEIIACDRPGIGTVDNWYQSVVSCQNIKGARFSGITISEVRFEARPYQLFGLRIRGTMPGYTDGLGAIDGLTLRDFTLPQPPQIQSLFDGNGTGDGCVRNVTFEGIDFGGSPMPSDHVLQRGCTSGFIFN